ncbi:nuclear transport factor 2 family protein [Candidatus Woesearchaeota archaeon]|nr:nuclear transport factor 2 family protein [Candidatus Woesearchaeota archaeon]
MITDEVAKMILKSYEEAWVEQDTRKILSIFAENGSYQEGLREKFIGHDEIAKYWDKKVCEEQSNIEFDLVSYHISGDFLIAEWKASFDSDIEKARITVEEVAIMRIEDGKIKTLKEYWRSKKAPHKP